MKRFEKALRGLLIGLAAGASGVFAEEMPEDTQESKARRWLNEHVIAVDNDGRAIEPYDFYTGLTLFPFFEIYHAGKKTRLQTTYGSPGGEKALKATGLAGVPGVHLPKPEEFIFRDVVLPHMLDTAVRSKNPIVLFVHGGMNNRDEAIKRAWEVGHLMETQGVYPIFVCWESGMISSLGEHISSVRNGTNIKQDDPLWSTVTRPVYLATDIAASAARFPRTLLDVLRTTWRGQSYPSFGEVQDAEARYGGIRAAGGKKIEDEETRKKSKQRSRAGGRGARLPLTNWRNS